MDNWIVSCAHEESPGMILSKILNHAWNKFYRTIVHDFLKKKIFITKRNNLDNHRSSGTNSTEYSCMILSKIILIIKKSRGTNPTKYSCMILSKNNLDNQEK